MNNDIEALLPSEVLDEIIISDQQHILSNFEEGDYTADDVNSFVEQVVILNSGDF